MSPRNKGIVLVGLVVVLLILAYLQLVRPSSPTRSGNAAPPPARNAPATPSAAAGAEAQSAGSAQDSGPSGDDLRDLASWFDVLRPKGSAIVKSDTTVFGIAAQSDLPGPETSGQEPSASPGMSEPGKLGGIIKTGDGPARALFQGKLYRVGETVRGTTFIIVSVDDDSVTLKSGDRVIRRSWHD